jgi:hypothetical protein
MKKQTIIFFIVLLINTIAFAEQRTSIEEKNVYSGKTILITFSKEEQLKHRIFQLIDYFDSENNIAKRIYTNTESVSHENGMKEQIQYYTDNIVTKYEMSFTDDYYNINGYNRLIEEVEAILPILLRHGDFACCLKL